MAILAKKHLQDFVKEQYKQQVIPFCVISNEEQVGKYLEVVKNNGSIVDADERQIIVLVLDFEKNKSIIN